MKRKGPLSPDRAFKRNSLGLALNHIPNAQLPHPAASPVCVTTKPLTCYQASLTTPHHELVPSQSSSHGKGHAYSCPTKRPFQPACQKLRGQEPVGLYALIRTPGPFKLKLSQTCVSFAMLQPEIRCTPVRWTIALFRAQTDGAPSKIDRMTKERCEWFDGLDCQRSLGQFQRMCDGTRKELVDQHPEPTQPLWIHGGLAGNNDGWSLCCVDQSMVLTRMSCTVRDAMLCISIIPPKHVQDASPKKTIPMVNVQWFSMQLKLTMY